MSGINQGGRRMERTTTAGSYSKENDIKTEKHTRNTVKKDTTLNYSIKSLYSATVHPRHYIHTISITKCRP